MIIETEEVMLVPRELVPSGSITSGQVRPHQFSVDAWTYDGSPIAKGKPHHRMPGMVCIRIDKLEYNRGHLVEYNAVYRKPTWQMNPITQEVYAT